MYQYNESEHIRILSELDVRRRVVFALLCASRLLLHYRRFHEATGRGDYQAIDALADKLWQHVEEKRQMSPDELQCAIEQCTNLIPTEEQGWDEQTQAYAEDASSALAYAFRTALTGAPQEAAWAGRHAYEAMDYYAQKTLDGLNGPAYDEQALIGHPAVQMELRRQSRDMAELQVLVMTMGEDVLAKLRRRAESEVTIIS